jgi:hypothetical protein
MPKLIGSGFKVQRLLPMDAGHHIDQDPEYPTHPFGCNGFLYMTKTENLGYKQFGAFSTLNVEP